jgi:asparagine synthase (glutamine-hydrolysing)
MSGICGIFNRGSAEINPDKIVMMRDVMANRGPSGVGIYTAPHIGLGHRTLALPYSSGNGRQPLSNENEEIWIVCDGEIYNSIEIREELAQRGHNFRSMSDAEILVHGYEEWGLEYFLRKINGNFAFAVWNSIKEQLLLVKDRVGTKPIYFMENCGCVYFSSDIKSIWLGYDKELCIDDRAIDSVLHSYSIPQEYSIFKGVKKVFPGQYVKFTRNDSSTKRFWFLSFAEKKHGSEVEFIEETENKLLVAVKKRMTNDTISGALLSGGVDSSLIVAMMAMESGSPVKTFSLGFNEVRFSELKYARKIAERYSTDHHELILKSNSLNVLPEIVWNHGEPFGDASQIAVYHSAKMAKQHVSAIFAGDGGDESFAGYSHIRFHYFRPYYRKYLPKLLTQKIVPLTADAFGLLFGDRELILKCKKMVRFGKNSLIEMFNERSVFGPDYFREVYTPDFIDKLNGHRATDIYEKYLEIADGETEVEKILYADISTLLPNDFLTKVDCGVIAHSLVARVPFLDHEVMEYAAMIPMSIKYKPFQPKYLLKKVAEKYVPYNLIHRKKQGFAIPVGDWLRNDYSHVVKEILLSKRAINRGYFNKLYINRIITEHMSGKKDQSYRIWVFLCLELWHLMFIDKVLSKDDRLVDGIQG